MIQNDGRVKFYLLILLNIVSPLSSKIGNQDVFNQSASKCRKKASKGRQKEANRGCLSFTDKFRDVYGRTASSKQKISKYTERHER